MAPHGSKVTSILVFIDHIECPGLRTADGVPREALDARVAAAPALRRRIDDWLSEGLMEAGGDRVRLTERGYLLSDALFVDLL